MIFASLKPEPLMLPEDYSTSFQMGPFFSGVLSKGHNFPPQNGATLVLASPKNLDKTSWKTMEHFDADVGRQVLSQVLSR